MPATTKFYRGQGEETKEGLIRGNGMRPRTWGLVRGGNWGPNHLKPCAAPGDRCTERERGEEGKLERPQEGRLSGTKTLKERGPAGP